LRALHDEASGSEANQRILNGGLTPYQYELFLKQRLATFEVVERRLYRKDAYLPTELKNYFGNREQKIVLALRSDLGMLRSQNVDVNSLPESSRRFLRWMNQRGDYEVAMIGYIMCGGSAFGAKMLGPAIKKQLPTAGIDGLSSYYLEDYYALVGRLNKIQNKEGQAQMLNAGVQFMKELIKVSNGHEFHTGTGV
jgi:hypothetical protein